MRRYIFPFAALALVFSGWSFLFLLQMGAATVAGNMLFGSLTGLAWVYAVIAGVSLLMVSIRLCRDQTPPRSLGSCGTDGGGGGAGAAAAPRWPRCARACPGSPTSCPTSTTRPGT